MTPPSVLFLGHGGERSGPPVFLANFQRWLATHSTLAFATALTRGGPLVEDYRRWGPVRVLDPRWTGPRLAQQGLARVGAPAAARRLRHHRDRAHLRDWRSARLVYLNTASPATLRVLAGVDRGALVLAHVHELEVALRYQLDDAGRRLLVDRPDRFVAASQAVAANLTANHGVAPDRIEVHHEFIEPVAEVAPDLRRERRRALGIDPDAFVVGASGMTDWRKAPDLFVRLAHAVRQRTDRPLAFVWVGGATAGPEWWPLDHEARHLGVDDVVRFVGPQEDSGTWFGVLDVFALVSREDAFPLAALEAASAAVPIVTFDTGGMVEMVTASDAGVVVPYPDIDGFAEAVVPLMGDDRRRTALGAAVAAHVRANHTTDVSAPRLLATVEGLVG